MAMQLKIPVFLALMSSILIYSPQITIRLKYTFRLVFKDVLLLDCAFTNDVDQFEKSEKPKLIYAEKCSASGLYFNANGLLHERGIRSVELNPFAFEDSTVFFPVYDKKSALPFDVFSAIFYLVSRYEEYQPFVRDVHGRFTAKLCVAATMGILEKPVVNIWSLKVKQILREKFPDLQFPERKYKFVPTYDIDSAYAYAHKGLVRSVGGILLALKSFDWEEAAQRVRVLLGREKDPFDTYDLQIEYQKKYNLKPLYFILFGHYGRFDKNLNTRNRIFRKLVKRLGDYAKLGIHPSYASNEDPQRVAVEIRSLSNAIKKEITFSRQHFLRLTLPDTYRNLIENDISDDYTMGYAYLPGFRAGICNPYNFYDLDMEIETRLRLHPFAVMDGTLKDYLQLSPEEAIERIRKLIEEVRKVDGTFISLWHNESLSNQKRWKGWLEVYEKMLEMAVPKPKESKS